MGRTLGREIERPVQRPRPFGIGPREGQRILAPPSLDLVFDGLDAARIRLGIAGQIGGLGGKRETRARLGDFSLNIEIYVYVITRSYEEYLSIAEDLNFRIMDIVDAKRPPVLFLENVKNLRSHDKGNTWRVIQDCLVELNE